MKFEPLSDPFDAYYPSETKKIKSIQVGLNARFNQQISNGAWVAGKQLNYSQIIRQEYPFYDEFIPHDNVEKDLVSLLEILL